jgi:endonuclease YncB( thermonuclease family)
VYEYSARLIRVVDADTWILDVNLGFNIWARNQRIRATGLNAPELATDEGQTARAWVGAWFAKHAPDCTVTVRTQRDRNDNYGRLLGTITGPDGAVLNADMLAAGIAVPYPAVTAPTKEPQQ